MTHKNTKIILDARLQYNYATFYIYGLYILFDKNNISFQTTPFLKLSYSTSRFYNSGLPIILDKGNSITKIFIDTEDHAKIEPDRYEWCDIYAKVNTLKEDLSRYDKLMVIGPSFGITLESKVTTIITCLKNYKKAYSHTSISFKSYLRDYLYSFVRRRRISVYTPLEKTKKNYIFHASTLWYDKGTDGTTNKYRGEFLKACKAEGVEMEGGLFYIDSPSILQEFPEYVKYKEEYKDFLYHQRLSMDDYILKTKQSTFVFNTPSVCSCHGWKLAEYLCMGKAIISVPLTREMPGEGLIHGKHIHYIDDISQLREAIRLINNDADYRHLLEKNAKTYYETYLAPQKVIERIILEAQNRK